MPNREAAETRTAIVAMLAATAGTETGSRLCNRLYEAALEELAILPKAPKSLAEITATQAQRSAIWGLAATFKAAARQLAARADVTAIGETFEAASDHFEQLAELTG